MHSLNRQEIIDWLKNENSRELDDLFFAADATRRKHVGDEVHLRGLVEISSYCRSACTYCGLHAGNKKAIRYRMNSEQILKCAIQAERLGYGSVVLQSGEDPQFDMKSMEQLIRSIKRETTCAITLSLGERSPEEWARWRDAGADRYLLRFETSDPFLFQAIHPDALSNIPSRVDQLPVLRQLGYQVGSGVMIGFPGQTFETLADDLLLFQALDLDMIGVGPFLIHPETAFGTGWVPREIDPTNQVESSVDMACKVIALARLLRPDAHIPSTTALATLGGVDGRIRGLKSGANVIMPNLTPTDLRGDYAIYPGKNVSFETAQVCRMELFDMLKSIGRVPGKGPGHRKRSQAPTNPSFTPKT